MTKTVVIENTQTVVTEDNQSDIGLIVVQPQTKIVTVPVPDTAVVEVPQPAPTGVEVQVSTTEVVEVTKIVENTVAVQEQTPVVIEVVARGPQGPPGDVAGGNATLIVGYPVNLIDGQVDDLLSFTGTDWRNKPQEKVTDGGNF